MNKTGLQPVSRTCGTPPLVLALQKKKSDSFKNQIGLKTCPKLHWTFNVERQMLNANDFKNILNVENLVKFKEKPVYRAF